MQLSCGAVVSAQEEVLVCFVLRWERSSAVGAVIGSGMAGIHAGIAEGGKMAVLAERQALRVLMPVVRGSQTCDGSQQVLVQVQQPSRRLLCESGRWLPRVHTVLGT